MASAEPQIPASKANSGLTSSEFVNTMSHYHRAEIARMAGWRDRLDLTSNWAITVVAAMLSVSLSTATAHHGVLLFAMLLVLLLLWIEARRYRFFDVYRARVRQFERYYFAQIFSPQPDFASDWLLILGESLRVPKFLISHWAAFTRRLRRNYIHMFLILLVAWMLKLVTPSLQTTSGQGFAHSVHDAVGNAELGPVPGWMVIGIVGIFYTFLVIAAFVTRDEEGELDHSEVRV